MARTVHEKVWWSAYNLTLDCELKKAKVLKLALKAVSLTVIDCNEYEEVKRTANDKDMSAEDTLDTLRNFLN